MEYKLNLRKILSRRFRYFFKFHIQNIVIWGRKILAECRIFACGGEGDQCLSFPPAPSLNLRPCTQWRSRKFVKGRGARRRHEKFFGTFLHLTPLKTYFLIKFGPFWTKSYVFSPIFYENLVKSNDFLYFSDPKGRAFAHSPPPATPLATVFVKQCQNIWSTINVIDILLVSIDTTSHV